MNDETPEEQLARVDAEPGEWVLLVFNDGGMLVFGPFNDRKEAEQYGNKLNSEDPDFRWVAIPFEAPHPGARN